MSEAQATGGYRFGYVAIVGRPNVGKSTLLNRILGQKISIVTAKPQTTRQRIMGIKTTAQGQVVYLDTPGIHHAEGRALNRYMNRIARATFRDVDLVLFMVEAGHWSNRDLAILEGLRSAEVRVVLVINKIDRLDHRAELLEFVQKKIVPEKLEQVLMISATRGDGIDDLEAVVLEHLPFSRPFYDEDQITDRSERFLAAELIREALTERLHQELPYALTVEIEEFSREGKLLRIGAIIWVERDSQKQIVIGQGGRALKQVGRRARGDMETLFDQKVFLRTWVKVSKDWTRSQRSLARFGYGE